jgi:hypothetical protein
VSNPQVNPHPASGSAPISLSVNLSSLSLSRDATIAPSLGLIPSFPTSSTTTNRYHALLSESAIAPAPEQSSSAPNQVSSPAPRRTPRRTGSGLSGGAAWAEVQAMDNANRMGWCYLGFPLANVLQRPTKSSDNQARCSGQNGLLLWVCVCMYYHY